MLLALFFLFIGANSNAQVSVNSSDGYTVTIDIIPTSIAVTPPCPWGYNYNVNVDYEVTFSGTNIPANLYTLQGSLTCGSDGNFFDLPNSGGTGSTTSTSNPYRGTNDCATATPSSLGCTSGTIQIDGPGIPTQTVPFSATVLPIELTNFDTRQSGNFVLITWETASEKDNDFFTLEKSTDGQDFEILTTIDGQGNSNTPFKYQILDRDVYEPTYYRLSQTDYDGSFKYEGIIFHDVEEETVAFDVFPNPNSGGNIQLVKTQDEKGLISIFSLDGRIIFQQTIDSQQSIQPDLKAGHYIIQWAPESGKAPKTIQFIQG